nr:efflux RND transporter periplasmic adaptor subunit [Sphingomonas kyeonggiensis]
MLIVCIVLAVGLWLANRPSQPPLQGEVDADTVNIGTKVLSRVDKLLVDEGDRVEAGGVLALLSSPEVGNGQLQAQAALDSAQAAQSLTDEGSRVEDITSLRANWQAAEAQAALASTSSARADRLFAQGVIAAQRRDEARAARESSVSAASALKAQYLKAVAGARPQARRMAEAQVRIAAAGADTAQSLDRETRLVSPISGEVVRRLVRQGEIVSPILPALQVVDIDHPYVLVNVREDDYRGLREGRVLSGRVPALSRSLRFRVRHIAPQGSFATFRAVRASRGYDVRAFEVKLYPVEKAEGLRPGMSVLFEWPQ